MAFTHRLCACAADCAVSYCAQFYMKVSYCHIIAHHVFIFFSVDYNKKNPGVSYHVSNDYLIKTKLPQQPPAKHNALKNMHENCSHQRWEIQAGGD